MNPDQITLNEVLNSGSDVHLYRDDLTGMWTAYGISAYLLSRIEGLPHIASFSGRMQMPCVCITDRSLRGLTASCLAGEDTSGLAAPDAAGPHRLLRLDTPSDEEGYIVWTASLK